MHPAGHLTSTVIQVMSRRHQSDVCTRHRRCRYLVLTPGPLEKAAFYKLLCS